MPRTIKEFWSTSFGKWVLSLITIMIIGGINQIRADVAMQAVQDQIVLNISELKQQQQTMIELIQSGQISETALSGHVDLSDSEIIAEVKLNTWKIDTHMEMKEGAHK